MRMCPRCKKKTLQDADVLNCLSRRDNNTYICESCGRAEAMYDFDPRHKDEYEDEFAFTHRLKKMNIEQWIKQVKELLDKHRPVDGGLYALCWFEGKLVLRKKRELSKLMHPLVTLTAKEINWGLTPSHWYSIGCKLAAEKDINPGLK